MGRPSFDSNVRLVGVGSVTTTGDVPGVGTAFTGPAASVEIVTVITMTSPAGLAVAQNLVDDLVEVMVKSSGARPERRISRSGSGAYPIRLDSRHRGPRPESQVTTGAQLACRTGPVREHDGVGAVGGDVETNAG